MMAKVTVTVCDKCESQEGVQSYEIKRGDQRGKVDLCREHDALDELLGVATPRKAPGRRPAAKKTAARPVAKKVTTMDEIEKLKKAK